MQPEANETSDPPGNRAVDGGPRRLKQWSPDDITEVLRQVVDPELHMNIVDLGLVYEVEQTDATVHVDMTLTSPGCPYGPYILHDVKQNLLTLTDIDDVDINIVWDPPWGPDRMTEEARLELGFEI